MAKVWNWINHNKGWVLIIILIAVDCVVVNGSFSYVAGMILVIYGFYRLYKAGRIIGIIRRIKKDKGSR